MNADALLTASAVALGRAIREGELSSVDVVGAHVARAEATHERINAFVARRFDEAMREAEAADARLAGLGADARAELSPFFGVPCSIKECFALEGMPNSGGLVARADVRATRDATAVRRLRRAGAIPLGVTNLSELCMWMESNNKLYGRTNNPYDPRRIVGGSSGGEGAVVAAGAAPFGLGSDIGGSIRLPAFFNGVFGHKPTGGLVPSTGQYPASEGDALRYLCSGPLCRRAEDLWPLLRILAGPDGEDSACVPWRLGDPSALRPGEVRALVVRGNGLRRVSRDISAAQDRAAEALRARGCSVEEVELPELKKSLVLWSTLLGEAQETSFRDMLEQGERKSMPWEILRWTLRRGEHTLPALLLAAIEGPAARFTPNLEAVRADAESLKRTLRERLGPNGVMLYPTYTRPAPKHDVPMLLPIDWVYTAVMNVLEVPATQVPAGLTAAGIPTGFQVVGTQGRDHVPIAVARWLEEDLGGWVMPPV